MLKKQFRLPPHTILQQSVSDHTPYFIMKISVNNLPVNRYGFVTSKHIDSRATVRNSAKRKLRGCIEELQQMQRGGYDMLFIIKKEIQNVTRQELLKLVTGIFLKRQMLIA